MNSNEKMVEICKLGRPYGVKGYLILHIISCSSLEDILSYGIWYIKKNSCNEWKALKNKKISNIGKKYIIKLLNLDNKEESLQYVNAFIGVFRYQLNQLNNDYFYFIDLLKMDVYNAKGDFFGFVDNVLESNSNAILVCCNVNKGNKKYLVPFIKSCIINVDYRLNKILISWLDEYFY